MKIKSQSFNFKLVDWKLSEIKFLFELSWIGMENSTIHSKYFFNSKEKIAFCIPSTTKTSLNRDQGRYARRANSNQVAFRGFIARI